MVYHKLALSALIAATISTSEAFTPSSTRLPIRADVSSLRMVATTPADLGIGQSSGLGNGGNNENDGNDQSGSMMDLTGIAFSVSLTTWGSNYLPVSFVSLLD